MRLCIIAIVLLASEPADACRSAFVRAIVGAPAFEPVDAVTITSETVEVVCDANESCIVVSTFGITVREAASVQVTGVDAPELTLFASRSRAAMPAKLDDESTTATLALTPADRRLEVRARVRLPELVDGCFTDGIIARHPYLASTRKSDERVLQIDTTAEPRVTAPPSWSLDVSGAAKPPAQRLWFTVPGRLVTHGGPIAFVGAASGEGRTLHGRGGWEAAIGKPWLVFALAGETDFADAWNVALTAEPTSSAWVLPLSFGAGAGVVLANGEHVGGRAQVSIALGTARVMFSVDVVKVGGGTDSSVAGLIGGSL